MLRSAADLGVVIHPFESLSRESLLGPPGLSNVRSIVTTAAPTEASQIVDLKSDLRFLLKAKENYLYNPRCFVCQK